MCQQQKLVISYLASPTDYLSRLIFVKTYFRELKKNQNFKKINFRKWNIFNFFFFLINLIFKNFRERCNLDFFMRSFILAYLVKIREN